MITDKCQREPVGMRDPAAGPAAANFYESLIFQLVQSISDIFAGDAVGHELGMGHDQLAVLKCCVGGVLDDDAKEGAAGIGAQCRESRRFQQLDRQPLPAKAAVIAAAGRRGMFAHHRPRLSGTGAAFVSRVEFHHQPLPPVAGRSFGKTPALLDREFSS
nr:hypothetical protein [Rhizobium leguminosarum]